MNSSKVTEVTTKWVFTPLLFFNVLSLPFTHVESQSNYLQKDFCGKVRNKDGSKNAQYLLRNCIKSRGIKSSFV